MADRNGYIGRAPGDSSVIIASQTFEPTGIQTDFTFAAGYTVGHLDVYFNGARLIYANDYTATNGSTVGLTSYANNGDVLELVAYKAFNVGNVETANGNFSVGNQLTVSGVTTATSAYYTGIITASSFSGDGSGLTGVASTDNIITGTAVTITGAANAVTLNVSGITTVGILTVYDTTQSTSASTGALVVHGGVGIAKSLTVDDNVTIGGTLTYEDMTNTDTLGFGTFRKGIEVQGAGSTTTTLNVTGIATIGLGLSLADNIRAKFGTGGDLAIYHDGSNSYIEDANVGSLKIGSDGLIIQSPDYTETMASFTANGAVDIYYNNAKRFETHNTGVKVTGIATISSDAFVGSAITMYASSGIVSATAFYGDGSNLEGVSASGGGDIDITSCLFI
jgi:hypothetical protein